MAYDIEEDIQDFAKKIPQALEKGYKWVQSLVKKMISNHTYSADSMNLKELKNLKKEILEFKEDIAIFGVGTGVFIDELFDEYDYIEERDLPKETQNIINQYRRKEDKEKQDLVKHLNGELSKINNAIKAKEKEEKAGGKKAYGRFSTRADSKEYAEFQAHKIVSAAFNKVFRR